MGKVDDRDVPFHRLTLTKGTTYNSYLLMTEKPTVIDTVDMSFGREYVESLKNIIELEKIKYIIINHTERSYGWSGEAIEVVQDYLKQSNIKVLSTSDVIKSTGMIDIEFPLRIRFSANEDNLKNIERAVNYTANLLLATD